MKKIFSAFVIASVFALGFMGALAVIPHSHDGDFSHESHQTCPVHQAGLGSLEFTSLAFAFILVFRFVAFLRLPQPFLFSAQTLQGISSRAPPASF